MLFVLLVAVGLVAVDGVDSSIVSPPADLYSQAISTKLNTTTDPTIYAGTYPGVTDHSDPAKWQYVSANQWTTGFFPATMYEMHRRQILCPASDGIDWLTRARKWSDGLIPMTDGNGQRHDQGFLSLPFIAELAVNPSNQTALTAVKKFASILAARFNPTVGCTESWDSTDPTDFQVIIDNMVNIDLLYASANITDNVTLASIAATHADTTMKNHFRGNYSTWHVVHYNATTGAVIKKVTAQGYADWSTWTRGQSWAIGFSEYSIRIQLKMTGGKVYNRTGYQRYLETARLASQLYLTKLPPNSVPPWDFDAPGNLATADTSSGGVAATALINLAAIERSLGNTTGSDYYVKSAANILSGISTLGWKPTWDSLLSNGTANYPNGSYQTGIVYGDYYYIRAGNDLIANGFVDCYYLDTNSSSTSSTLPPSSGKITSSSSSPTHSINSGAPRRYSSTYMYLIQVILGITDLLTTAAAAASLIHST